MKRLLLNILLIVGLGSSYAQTFTWSPEFFEADDNVTLTISNFDPQAEWGVSDIYLWSWHFDANGEFSGNKKFSAIPEDSNILRWVI